MPSLRSLPRLLKGFLVLLLLSTALRAQAAEAPIPDGRELPEIRIGYIEASFSPSERKAFAHTFLYLSARLPQYRFTIRPYLVKDLEEAVRTKSIDFFLAASGFYRRLNYRGLRDLNCPQKARHFLGTLLWARRFQRKFATKFCCCFSRAHALGPSPQGSALPEVG